MQRAFFVTDGTIRLPPNASDPSGLSGDMYFNSASGTIRFFNTAWMGLAPEANVKFIPSSPYTAVAADDGQILVWGTAGPLIFNVAPGLRNGWQCEVWQDSVDDITFTDAGGAVVLSRGNLRKTAGQYAGVTLCHLAGGQFRLAGDLA